MGGRGEDDYGCLVARVRLGGEGEGVDQVKGEGFRRHPGIDRVSKFR